MLKHNYSNEFNNHFSATSSKFTSEIETDSGDYESYLSSTDKRFI